MPLSYLDSVGDGEAGVGRGDLPVHQDHHQGGDADQSHADDVQTHRQPAHRTAEQVERSLVLVQQNLVPENNNTFRRGTGIRSWIIPFQGSSPLFMVPTLTF